MSDGVAGGAAERPGPLFVGVDGGGTRSRLAFADASGRELIRTTGAAGLVDPRDPGASAATLVELVRRTAAELGASLPVEGLCAGLAGAGDPAMRRAVRDALLAAGIAERVDVVTDGEIALDGALAGQAGVLLVAGTGSVAYGRGPDGRVERCGGWGLLVGDEGSGWAIARAALQAVLQAADGRGPATRLGPALLAATGVGDPAELPAWVGRAGKGEVAALAPRVVELADAGDAVADGIVGAAAVALARHVEALVARLGPWPGPVPVAFHGGGLDNASFAARVEARLATARLPEAGLPDAGLPEAGRPEAGDAADETGGLRVERRPAAADAVTGALRRARSLAR